MTNKPLLSSPWPRQTRPSSAQSESSYHANQLEQLSINLHKEVFSEKPSQKLIKMYSEHILRKAEDLVKSLEVKEHIYHDTDARELLIY